MLKQRDWSQADLARRLNCYPQQVSRLIKGDRGLSQFWIEKLSEAFNVKPARLLMAEEEAFSPPSMTPEANEKMLTIHQLLKQIHAEGQRQTAVMEEQTGILRGIAAALLERP